MPRLPLLLLLASLVLALSPGAQADEIVFTTDGRQLMLRDDGRFQFLTGQQRRIPVNPYLSNTNPYLTNTAPTRSLYVAPSPVLAPVPGVATPATPAVPAAPQAKLEEKPKGFLGILDGWIDEKKSKKSRIRK